MPRTLATCERGVRGSCMRLAGFEPAIFALSRRRSRPLSYRRALATCRQIRGPDSNRDCEVQSLESCQLDHPGRGALCQIQSICRPLSHRRGGSRTHDLPRVRGTLSPLSYSSASYILRARPVWIFLLVRFVDPKISPVQPARQESNLRPLAPQASALSS